MLGVLNGAEDEPKPGDGREMIVLKTGVALMREQVRSFFDGLFAAERSGEQFPVNLDDVWAFAFTTKEKGKRAILAEPQLKERIDYRVFAQTGENPLGGRPAVVVMMTVEACEIVFARKSRAIFDVYRACRRAVWTLAEKANVEPGRIVALPPAAMPALPMTGPALQVAPNGSRSTAELIGLMRVLTDSLVNQAATEARVEKLDARLQHLDRQVNQESGFFTLIPWAEERGVHLPPPQDGIEGKVASRIAREMGIPTGVYRGPRYPVHTYHEKVLFAWLDDYRRRQQGKLTE